MIIKATSLSRKNICDYVQKVKKIFGLEKQFYFPVVEVAENVLPFFLDDYVFEVVSKEEMGDKHGNTIPSKNIIKIREDVYNGAVKGNGRDRFTIAHEIGHLLLHDSNSISFCRLENKQRLKAYEDPEWQANCFAGELLASSNLIKI